MAEKQEMLINVTSGRRHPMLSRAPLLSSAHSPWRGVRLEQYGPGPLALADDALLHHLVMMQLDEPNSIEWTSGGRTTMTHLLPGHILFLPAMVPFHARARDTRSLLCVSIEPKLLLCAAYDAVQPDRLELVPCRGADDAFIRGTALALRAEVEAGYAGGRGYGELLAHTLSVHLVRNYSAHGPVARAKEGGLARHQLRVAIEFIDEHLAEDVPVQALATVVGLSPFHFARLFKCSTGSAPHQYRIQRRVERAKELLITSDSSIADIAHQVGFCDQSHFATHFKRVYGVTPKAFLRQFVPHRQAA